MIVRKQTVRFDANRNPIPKKVRIGYEGDHSVERLEFALPQIAASQSAVLMMQRDNGDADIGLLTLGDAGRWEIDLTASIIGAEGVIEAYVRVDGTGGETWNSGVLTLLVADVSDVEIDVERQYPTAVGQMLSRIAEHEEKMAASTGTTTEAALFALDKASDAKGFAERAETAATAAENSEQAAAGSAASASESYNAANEAAFSATRAQIAAALSEKNAQSHAESAEADASAATEAALFAQKCAMDAKGFAERAEDAADALNAYGKNVEKTVDVPLNITTGYYTTAGEYYEEYGRKAALLAVSAGEEYVLTVWLRSTIIAGIIFFDASGTVISYDKLGTGTEEELTDYRYAVPDGAAQMVVQNGISNFPDPQLRKIETVFEPSFYTKTESDDRYASKAEAAGAKFGIKWSLSDPNDLGSRCFAAEGMNAAIGIGSVNGSSDFDSVYPWSEMKRCNIRTNAAGAQIVTFEGEDGFTLDGSNGDVFVRVPRFCVEKYKKDGYEYRVITTDGTPHPAFIEGGRVLDEIFVGAYEGYISDGKLRSVAGVIPTSNRVCADYLAAARAVSDNHTIYDMRTVDALWTLMAVEYGCRNASQVLGYGAADFLQANNYYTYLIAVESAAATNTIKIGGGWPAARRVYMPVGSNMLICKGTQENVIKEAKILSIDDDGTYMTITFDGDPVDVDTTCFVGSAALTTNFVEDCPTGALTWHTGRTAWDAGETVRNPIRYRWIENPHGNLWHFLPDVTFDNLQMYVCDDMTKYEFCGIGDGYRPVGDAMPQQDSNGNKGDVADANYWIDDLFGDHFARGVAMGRSWDMSLKSTQAFGAYYYLNDGRMGIVNGGGFDHLWRCNMLTQRAWTHKSHRWYLTGARMMYKHVG